MAALPDSEAYFKSRAAEHGVPMALVNRMDAAGLKTLGHLAFSISRPGQDFSEEKFDNWLANLNGGVAASLGATAAMRRLHFEAEVVVTAALRSAVENPDKEGAGPKPLPYAERAARTATLKQQLPGLNVTGANEPSLALVDECVFQFETRMLRYVEPAKCGSRETEVMTTRTDKRLKIDTNSLSIKESKTTPDEDVSTAFKLHQCLKRRGIAYEVAGLISYRRHEEYVDLLMKRLGAEPPPGYQTTSINQILRADREVFLHMSQNVADIRPLADGSKPLDGAILAALQDYSVAFHMVPLPAGAPSSSYGPWKKQEPEGEGSKQTKGKPYQKGKGKSKSKGGSARAPSGFPGCVGRDSKGRNLCFNFNLNKCDQAPPGGSCSRGRHCCFKLNCYKPHRYCEAHKSEMPSQTE